MQIERGWEIAARSHACREAREALELVDDNREVAEHLYMEGGGCMHLAHGSNWLTIIERSLITWLKALVDYIWKVVDACT